MAEQELDGAYIRALLQQVNGKGVDTNMSLRWAPVMGSFSSSNLLLNCLPRRVDSRKHPRGTDSSGRSIAVK